MKLTFHFHFSFLLVCSFYIFSTALILIHCVRYSHTFHKKIIMLLHVDIFKGFDLRYALHLQDDGKDDVFP